MLFTLATRGDMRLNVLHDHNPLTVTLRDGGVRNAYTNHISNMKARPAASRSRSTARPAPARSKLHRSRRRRAGASRRGGRRGPDARGARAGDDARRSRRGNAASARLHPRAKSTTTPRHIPQRTCPSAIARPPRRAFRAGELQMSSHDPAANMMSPARGGRSRLEGAGDAAGVFRRDRLPSDARNGLFRAVDVQRQGQGFIPMSTASPKPRDRQRARTGRAPLKVDTSLERLRFRRDADCTVLAHDAHGFKISGVDIAAVSRRLSIKSQDMAAKLQRRRPAASRRVSS